MTGRTAVRWLLHACHILEPDTQLSDAERSALRRHAAGCACVVEIGVMQGASTTLLRRVMDVHGTVTGIDPHPAGRLGINFDRLIALSALRRCKRGRAVLLRRTSAEVSSSWTLPIDFLFLDGDHSWDGTSSDWSGWSRHVRSGGVVAVHDSQSFPGRPSLDSARFMQDVIAKDPRFTIVEVVETLTILKRMAIGAKTA